MAACSSKQSMYYNYRGATAFLFHKCVCVCVCVCERERESSLAPVSVKDPNNWIV